MFSELDINQMLNSKVEICLKYFSDFFKTRFEKFVQHSFFFFVSRFLKSNAVRYSETSDRSPNELEYFCIIKVISGLFTSSTAASRALDWRTFL